MALLADAAPPTKPRSPPRAGPPSRRLSELQIFTVDTPSITAQYLTCWKKTGVTSPARTPSMNAPLKISLTIALISHFSPLNANESFDSQRSITLSGFSGEQIARDFSELHKENPERFLPVFNTFLERMDESNVSETLVGLLPALRWMLSIDDSKTPAISAALLQTQGNAIEKALSLSLRVTDETSRSAALEASAQFLKKIKGQIIPKFSPFPVAANVPPPTGVPGAAGMDPAAIADPGLRAIYEKAISDNAQKSFLNTRQPMLKRLYAIHHNSLIQIINEIDRKDRKAGERYHKLLKNYGLIDSK